MSRKSKDAAAVWDQPYADPDNDPHASVRDAEDRFGRILAVYVICQGEGDEPGGLRLWLHNSIQLQEHYQWVEAQLRKAITINEQVRTAAANIHEAGHA